MFSSVAAVRAATPITASEIRNHSAGAPVSEVVMMCSDPAT